MSGNEVRRESEVSDRSIAELLKRLSDQTTTLARQEVDLAKAELVTKGKQAGLGAGLFGGASMFGLYALGALTACAILALATAVSAWLAALIVAAVYARDRGRHGPGRQVQGQEGRAARARTDG